MSELMNSSKTMGSSVQSLETGTLYTLMGICLTLGWFYFFLDFDKNISILSLSSRNIRFLVQDPSVTILLGLIGSYTLGALCVWLFRHHLAIFMGIWVLSLSVSEAVIPVIQPVMMIFRYFIMLILILYGVSVLFNQGLMTLSFIQQLGLGVLALGLIHTLQNLGMMDGLFMLPMQLTMFVGIFIGLTYRFGFEKNRESLGLALVLVAMGLTLINAMALKWAPNPFHGGRFHSWYSLATGFANNYVLFLLPMLWYLISSRALIYKCVVGLFLLLGLYLILLSGTRNALYTLLVATLIMCWLMRPIYVLYLLLGVGLLGLIGLSTEISGLSVDKMLQRFSSIGQREVRYSVWALAWSVIENKMIWGYGLAANLADMSTKLPSWERFDAHNALLGIWIRLGVLGVLGYVCIEVRALYLGYREVLRRAHRDQKSKNIVILFLSLFISIMLAGIFEENLSSRGSIQQGLWAIAVAVIMAEYLNMKNRANPSRR